jgi:hypothetical protein
MSTIEDVWTTFTNEKYKGTDSDAVKNEFYHNCLHPSVSCEDAKKDNTMQTTPEWYSTTKSYPCLRDQRSKRRLRSVVDRYQIEGQ